MQYTDDSVESTSKVLVSIMMSVSLSNNGKSLNLRLYDISRAYFQVTMERLIYIRLPQKIVRNVTKTKLADGSRACMELKMLLTYGSLVVRTGSVESQEAFNATSCTSWFSLAAHHHTHRSATPSCHKPTVVPSGQLLVASWVSSRFFTLRELVRVCSGEVGGAKDAVE